MKSSEKGKYQAKSTPRLEELWERRAKSAKEYVDLTWAAHLAGNQARADAGAYGREVDKVHLTLPYLALTKPHWSDPTEYDTKEYTIVRQTRTFYICTPRTNAGGIEVKFRKSLKLGDAVQVSGEKWTVTQMPLEDK